MRRLLLGLPTTVIVLAPAGCGGDHTAAGPPTTPSGSAPSTEGIPVAPATGALRP